MRQAQALRLWHGNRLRAFLLLRDTRDATEDMARCMIVVLSQCLDMGHTRECMDKGECWCA